MIKRNLIFFGTLSDAIKKADIIAYLVAHKECKNNKPGANKVVLDFCGVTN